MPENPTDRPDYAPQGYAAEFRKLVPSLILTMAVAFGTSWWNSQMTQNDLRYRLDRLEEKQRENAATTAAASQTAQNNAIRMAELGVIESNIVEQMKELKVEHEKLLRR